MADDGFYDAPETPSFRPSRNRWNDGDYSEPTDGNKRFRQQVSQNETVVKKKKVECATLTDIAGGFREVCSIVGGSGASFAAYGTQRHKMTAKKQLMSDLQYDVADKAFEGEIGFLEDFFLERQPEYISDGPANVRRSKARYTTEQWITMGFKKSSGVALDFGRGKRMANLAVQLIENFTTEMEDQMAEEHIAAGNPGAPPVPTDDQIKSMVQLAVLGGWKNRDRTRQNRVPVNTNIADVAI